MDYREREIVVISRTHVWLWLGAIVLGTPALSAEELERLFFTSAERKAMNEKRVSPAQKPLTGTLKNENPEPEPEAQAEVTESVRLRTPKITGKVIRSSGNDTIWFNQTPNYLPQRSPPSSRN
jgi:hypothetical protein